METQRYILQVIFCMKILCSQTCVHVGLRMYLLIVWCSGRTECRLRQVPARVESRLLREESGGNDTFGVSNIEQRSGCQLCVSGGYVANARERSRAKGYGISRLWALWTISVPLSFHSLC